MRIPVTQEARVRSAVARIMATPEGNEFYAYLLAEWERMSTEAGKAPNNDLLRQFTGQAEGVRWVIEMLAGALNGSGPNANGLVPAVSPADTASGIARFETGAADSGGSGSETRGTDSPLARGSVRDEAGHE